MVGDSGAAAQSSQSCHPWGYAGPVVITQRGPRWSRREPATTCEAKGAAGSLFRSSLARAEVLTPAAEPGRVWLCGRPWQPGQYRVPRRAMWHCAAARLPLGARAACHRSAGQWCRARTLLGSHRRCLRGHPASRRSLGQALCRRTPAGNRSIERCRSASGSPGRQSRRRMDGPGTAGVGSTPQLGRREAPGSG